MPNLTNLDLMALGAVAMSIAHPAEPVIQESQVLRSLIYAITMTTKSLIKAEIDDVEDGCLDELYIVIKSFFEAKAVPQEDSFMSRLKSIKINAPEDFSMNIDLYVSETIVKIK